MKCWMSACHGCGLLLVLFTIVVLSTPAEGKGKDGALYVQKYYGVDNLTAMGAAVPADVYVYQLDGTLVHSGQGNGSWKPGDRIDVPAGEYLVEVGKSRTRYNLRKFLVKPRSVTEVPTGWVAVTSWDREDQPKEGCLPWDSVLRAYVVAPGGKEHLVISNREYRGESAGRLQLAAGPTYRVYWHGLAVDVQVEKGKVTCLPTGGAGPVIGTEPRLAAEKSDAAGVPRVGLCTDGPTQALAGTWWLGQIEKIEDYPYEKLVWAEEEVVALDTVPSRPLRPDVVRGPWFRGEGSAGAPLAPEVLDKLSGYKEGVLKKKRQGGKFNLDSNAF
jgi:hypothetical protein